MKNGKNIYLFLLSCMFMFSSDIYSMLNFLKNKSRFQLKKIKNVFYTQEVSGKKQKKTSDKSKKKSNTTENVKTSIKKVFLGAVGGGTVYLSNEIKKHLEENKTWLEQIKEWWYSIYLSEKEQNAVKKIMVVLKPGPIRDEAWFKKIEKIFKEHQSSPSGVVQKKLDDIRNAVRKIVKKTADDIKKIDVWKQKRVIALLDEREKKKFIEALISKKNRYEEQVAIAKEIGVYLEQEDYNAVMDVTDVLIQ